MNKKLMIVDDEEIIRNGIMNAVNWDEHGYAIVAHAGDGKKALEIAKSVKPDIILTDISMPIMDGLEFADEVKQCMPDTVIIFLSGYNEFNYARRAIELGVYRYLTKPVQEAELLEVLNEASKDLEHRELEKAQVSKLKALIRDSLPLLKERFLLNLVRGNLKETEINSKLSFLNINMQSSDLFCMVISLDDYFIFAEKSNEDDQNLYKFAVQNIAEEVLAKAQGHFAVFEEKRNEIGVLFWFDEPPASYLSAIYPVLQEIQDYIRSYLRTTVSIGVGRMYKSLSEIPKSYAEARESLAFRTVYGKNSILYIGDINPTGSYKTPVHIYEKQDELLKAVKSGSLENSAQIMDLIFESFRSESYIRSEHIHLFVLQMIIELEKVIFEFDGDAGEIFGRKFAPLALLNFDTFDDIQQRLAEIIGKTVDFINSKRRQVNRNFIEKAKEFINGSFAREDLNLGAIAEKVCVSPGYLSQLFKQVEGISCVEYITKVRINNAKKLLKETTLKTYEIAEKSGYVDPQYFSTCFKKIVGVSPTDYRDIIARDIF